MTDKIEALRLRQVLTPFDQGFEHALDVMQEQMSDKIEVTRADRDAAADALDAMGWDWGACGDVRSGAQSHPFVAFFAAHRLAGERAGMERAAGIAEDWMQGAVIQCMSVETEQRTGGKIAQAIRAQAGEAS